MKTYFTAFVILLSVIESQAQFLNKKVIGESKFSREDIIHAFDLDGDGDIDFLLPNWWYKNEGNGRYTKQLVGDQSEKQSSIYASDLDGDEDLDAIISNSYRVAWCENDGNGGFSPEKVIVETKWHYFWSVYAHDLNGDGHIDVLASSEEDQSVFWCRNNGDSTFSDKQVIFSKRSSDDLPKVFAADMNGDSLVDVISATFWGGELVWYENLGAGNFSSPNLIHNSASHMTSMHVSDLDGDDDLDILTATKDDSIVWFENNGSGAFLSSKLITTSADHPNAVYASDLDGDGDMDVLSASEFDDKIAWYENDGNENFAGQRIINEKSNEPTAVYAVDVDGDNDNDVVSIAVGDEIAWYENDSLTSASSHRKSQNSIRVYPNPAAEVLTIALADNSQFSGAIVLDNMHGERINVETIVSGNKAKLHVANLPQGVYKVSVQSEGVTLTKLITIVR